MPVVSITRLRIRSWRYIPGFLWFTVTSRQQALRTPGNRGLRLLRERRNIYWTATVWDTDAAVRVFIISGPHGRVMHRLLTWCDEAAVARWTQENTALPDWQEAHRRMLSAGRRSKVRFPSPAHDRFDIPAPRT